MVANLSCYCLSDEMFELLSKLPENIAYTCMKCAECHPAEWRSALEMELQGCIRNVLNALLNSRTSTHLLRYRQVRVLFKSTLWECFFFLVTAVNSDLKERKLYFLTMRQAVKPPELNPEMEESLPSRRSPEGPDPPVLTEVAPTTPPGDSPPDLESVEKKMDQGHYRSLVRELCLLLKQKATHFAGTS